MFLLRRYLVPFTVGVSFITSVALGKTKALLAYTEEAEEEAAEKPKAE